jgi:23S rRNA pseudouridine2605 synthase
VLRGGRHRELRAAFTAVGLTVSRVIRIRFGPIELGKLRRGMSRSLGKSEVEALYAVADLAIPRAAPQRGARRPTAEPSKYRRRARAHGR